MTGAVSVATSTAETPVEAVASQDIPPIRVALRVVLASDFPCKSVTTTDETLSRLTLAHETPIPLRNRGIANGCEPLTTDEETTPGWSRTNDLRIRNPPHEIGPQHRIITNLFTMRHEQAF